MAQERFIPFLPQTRQVDQSQLIKDAEAPPLDLHHKTPTEEEARVLDQAFAVQPEERNTLVDGLTIAAAGILVHDLVTDTLASPEEEEEEDPKVKRKKNEP